MMPAISSLLLLGVFYLQAVCANASRPNIVIVMTDDQDLLMDSINYQPAVQNQFWQQGTFYTKHSCTMAQCCTSRASMWTGKCGHNTNVTSIVPPFGSYQKFVSSGFNEDYLPLWLQAAGYNTYYVGKFLNDHSVQNWDSPHPAGWTASDFLIDPGTYIYYNATMQRNNDSPVNYPGNYSTDLVSNKSIAFLQEAVDAKNPFFLAIMPIGPHSETTLTDQPPIFNPPVPAERHNGTYQGVKVPRTDNFNPEQESGVNYVSRLPLANETVVVYSDKWYQGRLESLLAVDDLINALFDKLEGLNLLANTYIIYTSDNGYHIGQHRLAPGKTCAFEEDVRIPFFIRGPNVSKNVTVDCPTSHTDIAPTIFQLAGIPLREDFDGAPIPVRIGPPSGKGEHVRDYRERNGTEHINIEFWGPNYGEGAYPQLETLNNNTYKSLRVVSPGFDLAYMVWCTNEHELYDMKSDTYQMHNAHASSATISSYSIAQLEARLDALLLVLKSCKGQTCIKPWATPHPSRDVQNLKDAMDAKYDQFYADQPKVSFEACADGYFLELEGPVDAIAHNESKKS